MHSLRTKVLTVAVVTLGLAARADLVKAAETCGNGADDDADGYADEGCGFANWVMGVCESPMSCSETGDIDPVTGAWVYQLPPDIAPSVPFGQPFEFRRTFMSMYSPPATNYRTAMGNRWIHNYQGWLDKSGTSVVAHLPTGQDVKFTYTSTPGDGFDYYNAMQPGAHFKHLRQAVASPNHWELKTLTGEVYKFGWASPVGKLIEIHDSLATANKIVIAYFTNGGNNGQIDTVTDASAKKRFKFSYSSGRVSSVAYQTGTSSWTTRVTLALTYASANPTTVQIAGTTIQTNNYASGYLSSIVDGAGKTIINADYVSATAGKLARVTTATGGVGYDYASTNAQCSAKTALFSNLGDAAADCDTDLNCSAGMRCGGKTGSGVTGKCYRAARCMATTSPSENLITTVSPFTPCTGACAPTAQYSWNTTTLDLKGVKLADNNWTSFVRDANGMVTTMVEGDNDDIATNAGGAQTWFFYGNASFPGRVTESRRRTDTPRATSCSNTSTVGCKQTIFTWTSDGLLDTRQELGFTGSGGTTSFSYTTDYSYDSKGRLTQIDGPLSGANDVSDFTYWTSTDVYKDGYTNLVKRKKNSTDFVTTTVDGYDYFGNAGSTQDPDGSLTCRTWDANRNYLSQAREAMNGQTSCTTTHASDLITSYVRDTALRLTRTTNPLGDCELREYDGFGRPTSRKVRDDCVATNAGNTRTFAYNANGHQETTEWLDPAGSVKRRQKALILDGGQSAGWENPVSPSYSRAFSYFADGALERVTFENTLGKTESVRDSQNRETTHTRFQSGTNWLSWGLSYPVTGQTANKNHQTVTDPASKAVHTYVDDLGRRTSIVSPDSGTTSYAFDAASRMVSMIEGVGPQQTHTFTFDNVGRKLTEDYGTELDCPTNPVDVQYTHDALPTGVVCPSGASCNQLGGRLAHVKSVLLCPSQGSAIYQETFYGYDAKGRLVSEYMSDTTGRTAQQNYSWDKNGNLIDVKAPSGASMTSTHGGTGNSDANLVTSVARTVSGTPTNLVSGVQWAPFGPVTQYDQENTVGGNKLRATLGWNLAYRATQIKFATTGVNKTTIDYTEDAKGRYTQKLYSNVHSGILNDYLGYDWLDRPTCDSPVSGACPTSGTNAYTNVVRYNSSNDRDAFNHSAPGYGDHGYTVSYITGKDTIGAIISSTAGQTNMSFDWRGTREFDDTNNSNVDQRSYYYDGQARVRVILGQYLHGFNMRDYQVTYGFDHRDRLVFRSFASPNLGFESHTFYYYDLNDRLIEVKHVPNIGTTSTYTVYNFYWLAQRPVAMWATSFPAATTARYFMHADESNRILEVYDWPSSGDATRVWAINPDILGWENIATSTIF